MATNQVLDQADTIKVTVPAGVVSGSPVAVGGITGVALIDRQTDGKTVIARRGSYNLTVTGATTEGAVLTATVAAGLVTAIDTTAADATHIFFGYATAVQAATAVQEVLLKD